MVQDVVIFLLLLLVRKKKALFCVGWKMKDTFNLILKIIVIIEILQNKEDLKSGEPKKPWCFRSSWKSGTVQKLDCLCLLCRHPVFAVSFTKVLFYEGELVTSFAALEVTEVSKLIKGVIVFILNLCTSLLRTLVLSVLYLGRWQWLKCWVSWVWWHSYLHNSNLPQAVVCSSRDTVLELL